MDVVTYAEKQAEVIYTATRFLPAAVFVALWLWLGEGTVTDPANLLLLLGAVSAVLALAVVRRYWHIRNTSKSRRDSSLLA